MTTDKQRAENEAAKAAVERILAGGGQNLDPAFLDAVKKADPQMFGQVQYELDAFNRDFRARVADSFGSMKADRERQGRTDIDYSQVLANAKFNNPAIGSRKFGQLSDASQIQRKFQGYLNASREGQQASGGDGRGDTFGSVGASVKGGGSVGGYSASISARIAGLRGTRAVAPTDVDVAWIIQNKAQIVEAMNAITAMASADVVVGGQGGISGITVSGGRATINLPIKAPSVSAATNSTDVVTRFNQLLASLRSAGLM